MGKKFPPNLPRPSGRPREAVLLSVSQIPLSPDARRALQDLVAASPEHAQGFWQRVKAAATPFNRKFLMERAAAARSALSRGVCDEVRIRHDTPPALAEHEHGLFLFVPAGAEATLLLDVSSVSDDARWSMHREGCLLRSEWHWLRIAGLEGTWCFASEGTSIAPRHLGEFHGTALEHRLTEEMDWPGDDGVVPFSMAEVERLARERPPSDGE